MGLAVVTKTRAHLPHAFAHDPANVWEEQLHDVWIGATERARVGRIPNLLAKAIGARTTIVYLSKTNAAKIRGKHSVIKFPELRALATAFQEEAVAREGQLHLAFWFQSPVYKTRTIKSVIKATSDGTEIYLKTMHVIARHRLKALRAKTMVLREKR